MRVKKRKEKKLSTLCTKNITDSVKVNRYFQMSSEIVHYWLNRRTEWHDHLAQARLTAWLAPIALRGGNITSEVMTRETRYRSAQGVCSGSYFT